MFLKIAVTGKTRLWLQKEGGTLIDNAALVLQTFAKALLKRYLYFAVSVLVTIWEYAKTQVEPLMISGST